METYVRNRNCTCLRCRCRGIMGPVVLMTLGVLFLLEELHVHNLDFDRTWPLLLISIGSVLMLQRTASTAGHIQAFAVAQPFPAQPMPPVSPPSQSLIPSSEVPHE